MAAIGEYSKLCPARAHITPSVQYRWHLEIEVDEHITYRAVRILDGFRKTKSLSFVESDEPKERIPNRYPHGYRRSRKACLDTCNYTSEIKEVCVECIGGTIAGNREQ